MKRKISVLIILGLVVTMIINSLAVCFAEVPAPLTDILLQALHGNNTDSPVGFKSEFTGTEYKYHDEPVIGEIIREITEGGPADWAGLKVGYVITSVDGMAIDSENTLAEYLSQTQGGKEVSFTVFVDGAEKTFIYMFPGVIGNNAVEQQTISSTNEKTSSTTNDSSRILQINLDTASDDELSNAVKLITEEQKARIVTKVTLDHTEITLAKGKTKKLVPEVTDLQEGVKVSKTTWSTSDASIAKVQNGSVSGTKGGKAIVTCTVTLSDGLELSADCNVTVIVAASGISVKQNNITLGIGESQQLNVSIKPDDVSVKKLKYTSEDSNIVSVDENGKMTAYHGGKTTITIMTTDGSEKSTKVTVYVPSISAHSKELTIYKKTGETFRIKYYGLKKNLKVTCSGRAARISYSLSGNELIFTVYPESAGSMTITVADTSDSRSKVTLKVKIDHLAVYDTVSYPRIDYDYAARYPESSKGGRCSFTGRVLQVINGSGSTSYRISSRGRWDNVVYVTINNNLISTPIIEDDTVTVYGTYNGNYTYSSIFGASITLPSVNAEKIVVK